MLEHTTTHVPVTYHASTAACIGTGTVQYNHVAFTFHTISELTKKQPHC